MPGVIESMTELPLYQLDAFTDRPFAGNPAAVCPLRAWLPDRVLQQIAMENNLSETAFLVPDGEDFALRWFTPALEVDLCGHATLASAQVVFDKLRPGSDSVRFETSSGTLTVRRDGEKLTMDFPAAPPQAGAVDADLLAPLGFSPREALPIRALHGAPYVLAVYGTEAEVAGLRPRFTEMQANFIVTAPGEEVDFVSRFFAPRSGVDEDPVTGSAHCTLAPFWTARLGKEKLRARQISARGGELECRVSGDRVLLTGTCVYFLEGRIVLPD